MREWLKACDLPQAIRGEAMKERPILFNGEMVRAILEGRKTQTRRVIKGQELPDFGVSRGLPYRNALHGCTHDVVCPYGQSGDRLWVRETFKPNDGPGTRCNVFPAVYKADYLASDGFGLGPWKPSIHMSRKYCRLLLDVKSVRVERLNDISEDDCKAEGARQVTDGLYKYWRFDDWLDPNTHAGTTTAKMAFKMLWDSINTKRGFGWSSNCWVWVIEFERSEQVANKCLVPK